ncbi:hypothetical protein HUJ04_012525 [Dendroctonus ponderosae]|nr:hypothetical protein HUJ04_012525 [Dendroctonus ponderosae]
MSGVHPVNKQKNMTEQPATYKYAHAHIPKEDTKELYKAYTIHEKNRSVFNFKGHHFQSVSV